MNKNECCLNPCYQKRCKTRHCALSNKKKFGCSTINGYEKYLQFKKIDNLTFLVALMMSCYQQEHYILSVVW